MALVKYKGRKLNKEVPVDIYRNVNKSGVWYSIRQLGRVVAYADLVMMLDCSFTVKMAGWRRYKKTGEKNVHAWIRGTFITARVKPYGEPSMADLSTVTYNPKDVPCFISDGHGVGFARLVVADENGIHGWKCII